jgi:hypothetical protein
MQTTPNQESTEVQKNQSNQELHEASSLEQSNEQRPQILALGRSNFGRSLNLTPIQLPGGNNAEIQEAERSDFVHPRK